jgi:hypothetical protein
MTMREPVIIKPLRFRYPLQHREPAAGFAARLATLNGRPMNQLLRDVYIQPFTIDRGKEPDVRKLAVLGDADAEELLRYTPKPATRDRFHVVAGETLGHRGVNRTYFRFCPHCVLEDIQAFEGPMAARPWLRLEWTIAHFRSCDEHGVLLTATTPIRRRFEPFNFSEAMGALLDNMQVMAESAPPHPTPSPFQAWLRSRLDGTPDPDNWLNKSPLYAAAEFCEALGVSALHHPKVKVETLSESDWATAADEGYRIASAGEASLRELLGRLNDAQAATRGVWGPRDTYGYAYGLLQRTRDDPAYETFRDVVRRFAMETMPIPSGTDVLGHVLEKQLVHTVRTAAMASGAHDRTIRRAFERNGLGKESLNAGLRNHRVTVPAEQIERMLKQLKTSMSTPKVIKATGIPRTHLNALVIGRYLPTVTGSEGQPDAKHRFARSEIEAMLGRLFKGAVEVESPTSRQMSIANARHAAVTSLGNLFEMIFEGHLTWKGHLQGRRDYGALLVDADEVTRLVRSGPAMTNLSRTEAIAAIPGFNRFALDAFLATRHLKTAMEFNPEARRMVEVITKDSVELFRGNFITLGELRELSGGLHLKRVKLLLKGAAIQPAFDPDEVKVWIYDRHAVDRVLAERPDFWVYDKAKALAATLR